MGQLYDVTCDNGVMRVRDEPHVDILRKKADILETENEKLLSKVQRLQREVLELKGMSPEAIELNLPGVLNETLELQRSAITRPGSEARSPKTGKKEKRKKKGHGPTIQRSLETVSDTIDLDEADKVCTECGGGLDPFVDDVVETIDVVERKWVIRKTTLKKYRCKCGGCIQTAEAPAKLIKGGRYTLDVAIAAVIAKHLDHLPLARQTRIAKRQGLTIGTNTLWDQAWALCELLDPLCARIRHHILAQRVIGVDETGFKLIQKGGSVKQQVWQLSCPTGIYFEILESKRAVAGQELFVVRGDNGCIQTQFEGIAVMDGAAELELVAKTLGFSIAGCWSHARRSVLKAEKEAPGQVRQFLELVGELYDVDKKAIRERPPDDGRIGYRHLLDLDKLRILRDTESRAACERIQTWMLKQTSIPGGLLRASLKYVSRRWTNLLRCLDDPEIPLDNNLTEGCFIGLAIGRRNYVGARSSRGTTAAGCFYTVVESANVNGHCPEDYLRYAASTLLNGDEPLLPHEWIPKK